MNDPRDDGLSTNCYILAIEILRRAVMDTKSKRLDICYPAQLFLQSPEAADFCASLGIDAEAVRRVSR